jgi:4-oxalocrotonate tautomerase
MLVRITLMGDVLSSEQKRQIARNVTDAIVAVVGENLRPYTFVAIDEAKSGDLALGGHSLTADDIRAIAGAPRAVTPRASLADSASTAEVSLA